MVCGVMKPTTLIEQVNRQRGLSQMQNATTSEEVRKIGGITASLNHLEESINCLRKTVDELIAELQPVWVSGQSGGAPDKPAQVVPTVVQTSGGPSSHISERIEVYVSAIHDLNSCLHQARCSIDL